MSDRALPLAAARIATLQAAANLLAARLVVRLLPLTVLRMTLKGRQSAQRDCSGTEIATGRHWARRMERAALRLPDESRCLPKAIALFWMLRRRGIEARLVIAIHCTERHSAHAYHAWLELAGEMLVGACDRSEYREIMAFDAVHQSSTIDAPRTV